MEFTLLAQSQYDTIGNQLVSLRVGRALTGVLIEQVTDQRGVMHLFSLIVLKFDHAAASAAIAQAFPFLVGHFFQRLCFPEGAYIP